MKILSARYVRPALAAVLCAYVAGTPDAAHAQGAPGRFVGCNETQDKEKPQDDPVIRCELRLSEPAGIAKATVAADGKTQAATFQANDSASTPTPVLFLLDQSPANTNRAAFARLKSIISRILEAEPKGVSFGVYAFANEMRAVAPLGTAPATSKLALEPIAQNPSGTSELFRNISNVLRNFGTGKPDRKILIVLSDGRFEDTAYLPAEVSKQLNDAGVTVFAVIPERTPDDRTAAQSLRRLAEETSGEFLIANDGPARDRAVAQIRSHLASGGFVFSPVIAKDMQIEAELSNGRKIATTFSSKLWAPKVPGPEPTKAESMPPSPPAPLSIMDRIRAFPSSFIGWIGESWIHQVGLGVAIVLIVVLGWLAARMMNGRAQEEAEQGTSNLAAAPMAPDLPRPLARFEFLDSNGSSELVHSVTTRIGRQTDNDIILKNMTVHRHHAILKREPNGAFALIDMDTENGVLVNGAKVRTAKLQDGDLVELGEVRMRFRAP